jgi:hypothetical protein
MKCPRCKAETGNKGCSCKTAVGRESVPEKKAVFDKPGDPDSRCINPTDKIDDSLHDKKED